MPRQRLVIVASVIGLAFMVASNAGATHVPQRPPVIVLDSGSPNQRAVWGTFCVTVPPDPGKSVYVTLCADAADDSEPRRLSVVRPGERITIAFRKTKKVRGIVGVYKRGCEDEPPRATFKLRSAKTRWVVPREFRWRFELSIFARFETRDGRSGDTEAALGLFVSTTRERGLLPNRDRLDCGEPY
jgi:hypothetical protein